MNRNLSIQIKAAFLLLVFGLSTVVGFACAIGIDMGFNSSHHHDEVASKVHVHADGKKQHHQDKVSNHHDDNEDTSQKDDCCNGKVVKISQADKAVVQSNSFFKTIFFTALIS